MATVTQIWLSHCLPTHSSLVYNDAQNYDDVGRFVLPNFVAFNSMYVWVCCHETFWPTLEHHPQHAGLERAALPRPSTGHDMYLQHLLHNPHIWRCRDPSEDVVRLVVVVCSRPTDPHHRVHTTLAEQRKVLKVGSSTEPNFCVREDSSLLSTPCLIKLHVCGSTYIQIRTETPY